MVPTVADAVPDAPAPRGESVPSGRPAFPGDGRPPSGPAHPPGPRLPHVPGFTGRTRETSDLVSHLGGEGRKDRRTNAGPAIAVISGGPGTGKTSLALHTAQLVADRYPAGGVLLPLAGPDGTSRSADEAAAELRSALPSGAPPDRAWWCSTMSCTPTRSAGCST